MLRFIFSPRTIVLITLVLAFVVSDTGFRNSAQGGLGITLQHTLIAILVFSAISIAVSAFGSFDITSKRAFVLDIIIDVIFLCFALTTMTYLLTLGALNRGVSSDAIFLTLTALGLSIIDFMISLNGGAGKLLEMDREHVSQDPY